MLGWSRRVKVTICIKMQKEGAGEVALKEFYFMRNAAEDLSETLQPVEKVMGKNHEMNNSKLS